MQLSCMNDNGKITYMHIWKCWLFVEKSTLNPKLYDNFDASMSGKYYIIIWKIRA